MDAANETNRPVPTNSGRTLDMVAAGISTAADHGAAVAFLVLFDAWRQKRSLRSVAARLAIVGFPVVAVNTLIKRLVGRPRPSSNNPDGVLVRTPTSSSFPSGHTLSAAAAAVALPESNVGQVLALMAAGSVGWSRLRLRAHHPSDVVGGIVIGGVLGLALRRGIRFIGRE